VTDCTVEGVTEGNAGDRLVQREQQQHDH
jgi:hypothetical protein